MSDVRLEYRLDEVNRILSSGARWDGESVEVLLSLAWKELVRICERDNLPIPTEEDYKAGRLTKTIIQE